MGEEEGEGKGQWREQGPFCFFFRDLTRAGVEGKCVCVGGTWHEMNNDDK